MERKPPVEMQTMTKSAPSRAACEVGGGGDRRLGAHGVVELVGQRLHLGQRRRVDVLEHEVHAGQRRRPEEVGHQLRAPLVAPAADDRHLGGHAATVQSRSWFASGVAPRGARRRLRWAAGSCTWSARRPSRRSCRAPSPRSTTPTSSTRAGWPSWSAPPGSSGARAGRPPPSIATLAAVFPANVQMALDAGTGRNTGPSDSRAVAWGRLPLQLVMAWAAPQARPDRHADLTWTIRVLRPGDDGLVAAASHLFDGPARPEATARFLAEDGHHLLVAYEGERAVGFVSGVRGDPPRQGHRDVPLRARGRRALPAPAGSGGPWSSAWRRSPATPAATACGWSPTTTTRPPGATYEGTRRGRPRRGQVVEVWTF